MSNQAEVLDDEDVNNIDTNEDDNAVAVVEKDEALKLHISRDDWIASGKDPDEWRSPREFKERGELIESNKVLRKSIERLKEDTDSQIKNLNTLHQIKLQNELEDLISKRDQAIEVADLKETKRLDVKIAANQEQSELVKEKAEATPQPQKAQEVMEFMEENPWAKDVADPRTIYANKIINHAMEVNNKTLAGALRLAEKAVLEKFSDPQKKSAPMVESSRTAGKASQSTGTLTWSQLTPAEEKCWVPGMWKDESEFLKAVANDRKGSK
jgi:hypothetical protein